MSKFKSCLLCGSKKIFELKGYESNYLIKCSECNFVFCSKRPTIEQLIKYYELYPRSNSISPITIKRYHELLDELEKFRMTNNIIDVGCGNGFFLEVAKSRGWNVYGTEFTDVAIEICLEKEIHMFKSPIRFEDFPLNFFDAITSFEVIEHISNPRDELVCFSRILRRGGLVYVTTPNFNSFSRNLLGNHWNIIGYPEHLCYYTKKTLMKLFLMSNFKLMKSATTGISINRLKRSIHSGHPLTTYNADEFLRKGAEKNILVGITKSIINFILNRFNKGDTIKAFFIKQ